MRLLVLLIAFASPIVGFTQTSTAEVEKAYYEVNVNGESAFYTDIHCSTEPFNRDQYTVLRANAMQKEGVFLVSQLEDGKTIRIAHLSFVEPETLKAFGNMICDGITVHERQPYLFE